MCFSDIRRVVASLRGHARVHFHFTVLETDVQNADLSTLCCDSPTLVELRQTLSSVCPQVDIRRDKSLAVKLLSDQTADRCSDLLS